jgi:hypothetical protein
MDLTDELPDYRCCTLAPDHPGTCVWKCNDCNGSGHCWLCHGDSGFDDVAWCSECDGIGTCWTCNGTGERAEP